jgi:AcrR family transcriptional regulator
VREAVLAATLGELVDHGYAGLHLEAIARRAGVHKTTVYRRWGDRERLLEDALLAYADRRVPIPDTGSLRGDLAALARTVVANVTSPQTEAILRAIVAAGDREPALAGIARRYWERRFSLAGEIARRAVARGELAPDVEPSFVVEILVAPIYLRVLLTFEPLDEGFVDWVVDAVLSSLATGPPHATSP